MIEEFFWGGGGWVGPRSRGQIGFERKTLQNTYFHIFSFHPNYLAYKPVGWIYNAGLAIRLKHYMWSHRAHIMSSREEEEEGKVTNGGENGKNVDRRALATSYLISHIDDAASAPANGYADRETYYADAATAKAIPHVTRTPLLFVSSADDPFLGDLPLGEISENPRTALVITERGGHCAFLHGEGESAWVDRLALEWLSGAVRRGRKSEAGLPLSKL